MMASLTLYILIATRQMLEITRATAGNIGYIGTLNGLSIAGSFFLRAKSEIMAMMYNVSAPKQAIVIISPVFPVSKATMPIPILTNKAFEGVLNFGCTSPNCLGAYPVLPN